MDYKLSICIPTYNRANYLEHTLKNIFDNVPSYVEVVIYDGASTDHTEELLYDWALKYPNLSYLIADTNGGVDEDLRRVVLLAKAEYCWLMSSDDFIAPEGIKVLLEAITKYSPNVLLFDRKNCNKKMQLKSEEKWLQIDSEESVFNFVVKDDLYRYLKDVRNLGGIFSYISSIVVKKSDWLQDAGNTNLIGSNYNHVGCIFRTLMGGGVLLYLQKPLVFCREDNDSFSANGLPARFLIDFKGYYSIGKEIFGADVLSRDKFYDVLRRDHHLLRLIKIRAYCQDINEWKKIEAYLIKLKYPLRIIKLSRHVGSLSAPILALFYLKNTLAKWRL
ncbi:glycosyltransferase [Paracoccaceae bacterium]|nr:glycosyltransferase [Paracoccaceae bacterium]